MDIIDSVLLSLEQAYEDPTKRSDILIEVKDKLSTETTRGIIHAELSNILDSLETYDNNPEILLDCINELDIIKNTN